MSIIRAFIGIDFPREVKNGIYDLQQRLRKYALKGRWKHLDNFHLTLKFLDEISLTQQAQIDVTLKKLCIDRKPFNLSVTGMGIFDGRETIRVLWLGLAGDIQELQSLHKEIDQSLTHLGFQPEKRRFRPHVTIAQDLVFKCGFDQIQEAIGDVQLGMIRVDSLFLFKSEQVQNKRIYSKVSEYNL